MHHADLLPLPIPYKQTNFSIFSQEKEFLKNLGQRRAVAAVLHCRTYEPDRVICTEGERGDSMFIVLYGRLSVSHIEKVRTPLVLSIEVLSLSHGRLRTPHSGVT